MLCASVSNLSKNVEYGERIKCTDFEGHGHRFKCFESCVCVSIDLSIVCHNALIGASQHVEQLSVSLLH